MRIRRLSEIDLARFCAVEDDENLRQKLRLYNLGGGAWSYDPVRKSKADILCARTPMFDSIAEATWDKLAPQISSACIRGKAQASANLLVAKTLYDYRKAHAWDAVKFEMGSLPLGFGETARYWSDILIDDGNGPIIAYFDHRRTGGITGDRHRQIVFSMQNVWIRERYLDLSDARLAVIRFPSHNDLRSVDIRFHKELDLLSYEDLDAAVKRVYLLWAEVSREREDGVRKTGTGESTPMGF
ncbi:hypothetical protein D3C72_1373110 [compost metagenome]